MLIALYLVYDPLIPFDVIVFYPVRQTINHSYVALVNLDFFSPMFIHELKQLQRRYLNFTPPILFDLFVHDQNISIATRGFNINFVKSI